MSREKLLDERDKIFYEILTKYYNKYGPDWNLEKIELFGTNIILKAPEHLKFPVKIKNTFKLFHQYVAGLIEEDFPNIKKIHTSPKFTFPRHYWTSEYIDKPIISDSKTSSKESFEVASSKESSNVNSKESSNVNSKESPNVNSKESFTINSKEPIITVSSNNENKKSRKRKRTELTSLKIEETITLAKFMNKISKDTSEDLLKIRKIIEQKDIEDKLKKPIVDRQKYFIMNLPFNIFMMLMSKGGVHLSGFIKAVKLNDADYKLIEECKTINNTKFLMSLYDHNLIY
jgi:hypothetical protein